MQLREQEGGQHRYGHVCRSRRHLRGTGSATQTDQDSAVSATATIGGVITSGVNDALDDLALSAGVDALEPEDSCDACLRLPFVFTSGALCTGEATALRTRCFFVEGRANGVAWSALHRDDLTRCHLWRFR